MLVDCQDNEDSDQREVKDERFMAEHLKNKESAVLKDSDEIIELFEFEVGFHQLYVHWIMLYLVLTQERGYFQQNRNCSVKLTLFYDHQIDQLQINLNKVTHRSHELIVLQSAHHFFA